MIANFQYITGNLSEEDMLMSIKRYCIAGGQWIQLRKKNASASEVFELAIKAKAICNTYNAKLIINDYPEIARAVNAYGVHLGRKDMTAKEARTILFDHQVIGSTCNSIEDIQKIADEGASQYIGLGPFRDTKTKKELSPVLALQGIQNIQKQCNERGIEIPVVAVGGITHTDIPSIFDTGVHGLAASGMVEKENDLNRIFKEVERVTQKELDYAKFEISG